MNPSISLQYIGTQKEVELTSVSPNINSMKNR